MAAAISAVSVTGARSASFAVSCLATEAFTFTALAAALADTTKNGGLTVNSQNNALYKFLIDNAAANLADTQLAWRNNGVAIFVVNNVQTQLDVQAAQVASVGALTAGSAQIRIALASSISA